MERLDGCTGLRMSRHMHITAATHCASNTRASSSMHWNDTERATLKPGHDPCGSPATVSTRIEDAAAPASRQKLDSQLVVARRPLARLAAPWTSRNRPSQSTGTIRPPHV